MAEAAISYAHASTVGGIVSVLTESEARDLTDRINRTAGDLCLLLVEAHERQAWRALGYDSWKEYAEHELQISRSYAYRQLDLGRVTLALASAVMVNDASPNGDTAIPPITEIAAREIKPLLPEVTEEIRERVAAGESPEQVVPDVVTAAREITRANGRPARRKAEPEPPPTDEHEPDLAQELEDAQHEIERLQQENASLRTDDAAGEIRRLSALRAQEYANNLGLQRELSQLREILRKRDALLIRIRKALGIGREDDILDTLKALQS